MLVCLVFGLTLLASGSGCACVGLADRIRMQTYTMRADRDPLGESFADHIHFTREAATGGRGVGGGGCGCN
jgi:hypothetical protein